MKLGGRGTSEREAQLEKLSYQTTMYSGNIWRWKRRRYASEFWNSFVDSL
jgi:hypothetical protein